MAEEPLRILIVGAHPDDADIKAGGTAAKWSALGHVVRLVSLTNGRAGHQTMYGPQLAQRRRAEAQAAAATIGATYEILDHPDGELEQHSPHAYGPRLRGSAQRQECRRDWLRPPRALVESDGQRPNHSTLPPALAIPCHDVASRHRAATQLPTKGDVPSLGTRTPSSEGFVSGLPSG